MTFESIYQQHFAFVWRTLRRLGVRESDAPDAAQEVFVVTYRRLPEFEGRAKVTTWLFRICMNVARDTNRRAHFRREVKDDGALAAEEDPRPGVESQIERREDVLLLEEALRAMDDAQRAVFILFELEGMGGDQIAEVLEIPLGTMYSRLRLARASFDSFATRVQAKHEFQALRLGSVR